MQQLQVNIYTDQRECMRLKHVSFVVVLDCKTRKSYLGKLHNYNRLGIYFELEVALNPGSEVNNGSEVLFRYGIGVKYNQEVNC